MDRGRGGRDGSERGVAPRGAPTPSRGAARAVLLALVLVLASPALAPAANPPATEAGTGPLDLAATTLRPADMVAPGYGLDAAAEQGPADLVVDLAEACGVAPGPEGGSPTGRQVAERLAEVGWQRQYVARLGLPHPADPARFARAVVSYVAEYADEAGAAAGFAWLEDEGGHCFGVGEDLAEAPALGDQAEATRIAGGDPAVRTLDLTFRVGRLVAGVAVTDAAGAEPDTAEVEALARLLLGRLAATEGDGGLSGRALRLAAPAAPPGERLFGAVPGKRLGAAVEEGYLRRGGADVPGYGEGAAAFAARQQAFAGAVDAYEVRQRLGAGAEAPVYRVLLARFPGEADAAAWFPGVQAFAQVAGVGEVGPVAAAASFGEESLTLSFRLAAEGAEARGHLISARVGNTVAIVIVRASPEAPLAAAEQLMAAQLGCLVAGLCPAAPPPAGLGA